MVVSTAPSSLAIRQKRHAGRLVGTHVNRPETGTVAGGEVLVHGLDSLASGHLTVLLVHVVSAGARVVTDPDAKVLDLEGVLLVDLRGFELVTMLPSPKSSQALLVFAFYCTKSC